MQSPLPLMQRAFVFDLAMDLFGNAFDGVVGGEYGAFLPGYEVGEVVSGEVGSTLGFVELGVGGLSAWQEDVSEAADGVGDLCPADINWLLQ